MKKENLKLLIAIFIGFVFVFVSCNDDDDDDNYINGLDNTTIVIDGSSAFNMVNFVASFEQLFTSDSRWMWDYSHDIQSGKAVTTYQNMKIHGKFGDKYFTIHHNFDANGIITSSHRLSSDGDDDEEVDFTYAYDTEGYIVKLTKTKEGNVGDIVTLTYDANKRLVTKAHASSSRFDAHNETFTYDTNGNVLVYVNERWDEEVHFTYTNGNMTKETEYYDGTIDDVYIYGYDTQGRLILEYEEGDFDNWREEYEYTDAIMRELDYYQGKLDDITEYSAYNVRVKRWDFEYDEDDLFEFCTTREYFYVDGHDRYLVSKKEYFEGTPENLILVGYVIVDTRDAANDYKKTKESIYDANDNLLYYVTYEVSNNSIQSHQVYTPGGTAINDTEMDQLMWMEELIEQLNIT